MAGDQRAGRRSPAHTQAKAPAVPRHEHPNPALGSGGTQAVSCLTPRFQPRWRRGHRLAGARPRPSPGLTLRLRPHLTPAAVPPGSPTVLRKASSFVRHKARASPSSSVDTQLYLERHLGRVKWDWECTTGAPPFRCPLRAGPPSVASLAMAGVTQEVKRQGG